jgi:hypothetical protein
MQRYTSFPKDRIGILTASIIGFDRGNLQVCGCHLILESGNTIFLRNTEIEEAQALFDKASQ